MKQVKLSDHFTYGKLLRFAFPSVMIRMVTSVYSIFDGYFISNFAGKNAFAAINLIMPAINILCSFAFMIGTGGSALIAKVLGEGKKDTANEYFSLFMLVCAGLGVVLSAIGFVFMKPISVMLGASELILDDCILYGRICCLANTFYMMQCALGTFTVVAEKRKLGLADTVLAGVTRVLFDWIFICVLGMETLGAGIAMFISNFAGARFLLVYFSRENSSLLRFTKTAFYPDALFRALTNGSSEMLSNLSMSLVGALYNFQLMRIAAEDGVAAYGVIMYVNFLFTSFFFGYSMGAGPVTGYHYGAGNRDELHNILKKSIIIVTVVGVAMTALSILLARPICSIYVGYDEKLLEMSVSGMIIYSLSFLFMGYNILGSAFFTGLNNGLLSAVISFLRTCVLQIVCIFTLPLIWGLNGIWAAVVVAELLTLIVTASITAANRKRYGY